MIYSCKLNHFTMVYGGWVSTCSRDHHPISQHSTPTPLLPPREIGREMTITKSNHSVLAPLSRLPIRVFVAPHSDDIKYNIVDDIEKSM